MRAQINFTLVFKFNPIFKMKRLLLLSFLMLIMSGVFAASYHPVGSPGKPSNSAIVAIPDDDNTPGNRILSVLATANATEGGAAGRFTIKLPGSVTATGPITVNYTVAGTATAVTDYAALSGTATILAGQNSVAINVTAVDDNVIEPAETVTLTVTGGTSTLGTYTVEPGNETALISIIDNDANVDAKRTLSMIRTAHAAEPATNGGFRIQLPVNITSAEDITVNYTVAGTATAGADYKTLSGSIVLPAGQNFVALPVEVIDDQLMEPVTESVTVTLTAGASASFTFPITAIAGQRTVGLNITDDENIPANRILTLTKIADASESGDVGYFRLSLPPNIYIQGSVNIGYSFNGSTANLPNAANPDFLNPGLLTIPTGKNHVDFPIVAIDDKIIENTETVVIAHNGSFGISGLSVGSTFSMAPGTTPITINILDNDNIPENKVVNVSVFRDGQEGGDSMRFNFSLPTGIIPSENVTINYTVTGTAVKGVDYTPLSLAHFSGTSTISAGTSGGTAIVASIVDDDIIEGTENVTITINSVTSNSFTYTFGAPATANIIDNDNTPANLVLAVTKTADAVEGGTNGEFTISLPGTTTTATEPVTVNYTLSGTAVNGTDYTTLTGAVVIPAGDHEVKIPVSANTDQVIEDTETVTLTITGGSSTSFSFTPNPTNANATVDITDATNTPANRTLSITKLNDAAEPGTPGRISIALPAGITAAENINVSYTVAGTATAGIDYTSLSGTATIPAGQNSVIVPIDVIDDQVIEQTETVILTLTAGSSTSFTYTAAGDVTVDLTDDDNIAANLVLNVTKTADAAEPGTPGSFRIALPTGITVPTDITVNYTVGGTAIAGKDYTALTGVATIPAGNHGVDLALNVIDDLELEGTETVTLTVSSGTATGLTFTGGSSGNIDIADDESLPGNLVLTIVKVTDAAEPATNGNFNISLPTGVTTTENITVNYTVGGTAIAGTDYTTLPGTATILAGQNSVDVPLLVIDDNNYEPIKTVILTLTGGTSARFSFTPSTNNTATASITDNDKMDQVITFAALPVKILGDPGFTLTATGGASGNPVTFTSSNPAIATVTGNVVTIVGTGTVTITASQVGNAIYHAAADVSQVLTVIEPLNTAPTLAAIANQQICITNAPQSIALSGISAGTETGQITTLSVSSSNPSLFSALSVRPLNGGNGTLDYTLNGAAGTAIITVTVKDNGGTANGGVDTFTRTFTLTVSPLPQLMLVARPGTSVSKGQTLEITASGATSYTWSTAAGTINGQTSATLTVRPAQTTTYTVTGTNVSGCTSTASITITVIEDYNVEGNNILTPNGDGKNDFFVIKNIDMYPDNEVRIFDRAGRAVYTKKGYNNEWDGTISGRPLEENTYYYIIDLGKGVKPVKGYITIVRKY